MPQEESVRTCPPDFQPKLSIIVPTVGRPSLLETLRSIQQQVFYPGDELLVVADGTAASVRAREIWSRFSLPGRLMELAGAAHDDWGNEARRRGLAAVSEKDGRYICYLDDDDCYVPGALSRLRTAIQQQPRGMFLFRMQYASGRWEGKVLWTGRELVPDNIGTPMFVHPAEICSGEWGRGYRSDYEFIRSTVLRNPDRELFWREEVIVWIRPVKQRDSGPDGPVQRLG